MSTKSKKKLVVVKSSPVIKKAPVDKKDKSKMEVCEHWLGSVTSKTRQEVLKKFQEFGVTEKGSSTYYQILVKRLNWQPAPRVKRTKVLKK